MIESQEELRKEFPDVDFIENTDFESYVSSPPEKIACGKDEFLALWSAGS